MEYTTLNLTDKLRVARDALYGAEQDHFRVALDPASGGGEARLKQLEDRINRLREEVDQLEKQEAEGDRTAEPAPAPTRPIEADPDDGS